MRLPELLQICLFLGECAYFSWERHSAHWHEHASSTLKHASWSQTESREASHKNGFKRMKWLNKGIPMHLRPYHPFCRVFQVLRKTGNWVTFFSLSIAPFLFLAFFFMSLRTYRINITVIFRWHFIYFASLPIFALWPRYWKSSFQKFAALTQQKKKQQ